jgi:hypothetical protein
VTVLTDTVTTQHRTFVTATLLAYCGPELYFLLGSLLVSPQFSYFGDNVWARNVSAVWFVLAQGAATAVLAAATLLFLWKPSPNVRPTSMTPLAR